MPDTNSRAESPGGSSPTHGRVHLASAACYSYCDRTPINTCPPGGRPALHIRDRIARVNGPLELGRRTDGTPATLFHQLRGGFPLMPLRTLPQELGREVDIGARETFALPAAGQLAHMGQRLFGRRIAGRAPVALEDQPGRSGPTMALGALPAEFVRSINIGFR